MLNLTRRKSEEKQRERHLARASKKSFAGRGGPSSSTVENAEDEQTCEKKKEKNSTLAFPPLLRLLLLLLSLSLETGTYEGDSDLQLERVNVYFNEATGGEFGGGGGGEERKKKITVSIFGNESATFFSSG